VTSAVTITPRRILMTADAVGGVWTYALGLSRALSELGVEVILATMGPRPGAAQRAAARAVPGLTLLESDYLLEWMDDPWSDVRQAGRWLLELASVYQPDIVHLNGYAHAPLPFRAPVVVVGHSCVLSWWQAVHGQPAPSRYAPYQAHTRAGLRAADAVVAPTAAMLAALSQHYGAFAHGLVIPNGSEPSAATHDSKQALVSALAGFGMRLKTCACSQRPPTACAGRYRSQATAKHRRA